MSGTRGVSMHCQQAGHPGSLGVGAPHQVAGAFGGHHDDVHLRRRLDDPEVNVEAVGEQQGLPRAEVAGDMLVIDVAHVLVGNQQSHQVGAGGGLGG